MRFLHVYGNAIETIQLQKKKKEWNIIRLDIESLSIFLCLRYCRSLNSKVSVSAFGGQLYRNMTNFARVVTRKIDGTLETEHSRQTEFKTASEKESKRLMENKSN